MTPRAFLIGSLGFGMMAAAPMFEAGPALAQVPDKKPNIVFMLADNLGYGELWRYGGGILRGAPTPRITASPGKACACSTSTSKRNARPPGRPS
jgi:hypothetical protein